MPKRKYQKPLHVEGSFEEVLERFAHVAPAEVQEEIAKDAQEHRVRLIQRAEGGDPLQIYNTPRGAKVELLYREQSFWATQKKMAEMFGVTRENITIHLGNIFQQGELLEAAVCKESLLPAADGKAYPTKEYNLNALISVGYRVGSVEGTIFRIWATDVLVQILTKGYYIDIERLKNPAEVDRVAEVRAILQDIRSEQANVHRELERICAQCKEYNPQDPAWSTFFKNTAAGIFYASVQVTPSEVIMERANASAPDMGLRTWPKEAIRKQDVTVAKNYLGETELGDLNRFSSLLLDFMLDHAVAGRLVTMAQASARIEETTKLTGRKVLKGGGSVKRKDADNHAHAQYAIFDARRKKERYARMDRAYDDEVSEPKKLEKKG